MESIPAPDRSSRDGQRARVYEAERLMWRMLDRSAEFPVVQIAGSRVALPVERKFGTISSVQGYVDQALELNWVRTTWVRATVPVFVRERSGHQKAHYERVGSILAIPLHTWALRETVVLHELAHHLAEGDEPAHGPEFVARLLALVSEIVGPEAGFLLRVNLLDAGAEL